MITILGYINIASLFFILLGYPLYAALDVHVESECALLVNADTGKILYEKNAHQPMYPASTTKVAFGFYTIKYYQNLFNKKLCCSSNCLNSLTETQKSRNNFANYPSYILEKDASHVGLKAGEEMLFYDLLEASMIVSADDASNVLAEEMGGRSIGKCVEEVNTFIASLGCKNTHFTNPHGLHHPDHVTTAYDLMILCREAMKDPLFAKIVKMTRFQRPKTNKQEAVSLKQTNRLLNKNDRFYYAPAVGIKTGSHRRAGFCLTAQAEKNGRKLIAVILHANTREERYMDTINLFEAAFQENKMTREFFPKGPQEFEMALADGVPPLRTKTNDSLQLSYYPSEAPEVACQLVWHPISLPVKQDSLVGELQLYVDSNMHQTIDLFAANDVELTFMSSIHKWMSIPKLVGLSLLALILLLLWWRR